MFALGALALVLLLPACAAQQTGPSAELQQTQAQLGEMQKTLANMNLRLEELNNSVFILQESTKANRDAIRDLRGDLDKPTIYITPEPGAGSAAPIPLPQGGDAHAHLGAPYTPPPSVVPSAPQNAAPTTPKTGFDAIEQQFRGGYYGLAALDLATYLAQNPGSPKALKARYMLAESYYQLGDFSMAAREFGLLLSAGGGAYAPAATLRSAQCFLAQGQGSKAKELFKKVVSRYPESGEARTAEQELAKL
ncbi:MAG: tetratricopeptide repeat protein [Deltaproteobacteria bacterium]|nr:tetratricopeptide repeat protein [Deltaproteobacteria bacterium]